MSGAPDLKPRGPATRACSGPGLPAYWRNQVRLRRSRRCCRRSCAIGARTPGNRRNTDQACPDPGPRAFNRKSWNNMAGAKMDTGGGTHTRAHRPFHTHAGTPPFSTCIVPFGPLPKNAHTGAGSTWTRILSKTLVHMDKPRRDCCGHHRSRSAPPAKSWGSVFAGRLRQLGVRGDDPHEHVRGVLIPQDKIGQFLSASLPRVVS